MENKIRSCPKNFKWYFEGNKIIFAKNNSKKERKKVHKKWDEYFENEK